MQPVSKEFWDEAANKMQSDEAYKRKAKNWTGRLCFVATDCPGGIDRLVDFDIKNGIPTAHSVQEAPAPSEWRTAAFDDKTYALRLTGPYEAVGRAVGKQMPLMAAVADKTFKLDGSMTKLMGMMEAFGAWIDLLATIPTES